VTNTTQVAVNATIENGFAGNATEDAVRSDWGSNARAEFGPIVEPKDSFTEDLQAHLREMQLKFENFTESLVTSNLVDERGDTEESDNMTMPVAVCMTIAGK
jgi:hypothetical protein